MTALREREGKACTSQHTILWHRITGLRYQAGIRTTAYLWRAPSWNGVKIQASGSGCLTICATARLYLSGSSKVQSLGIVARSLIRSRPWNQRTIGERMNFG